MKIKIVIQIKMHCEKCRNKALRTAAEVKGVTSVSLDGDDKDRVVVTGDNVNTICLANRLQKKFRCVTILTVEEVKKKPEEKKEEKKDDKKECCAAAALLCLPAPPKCTKCDTNKCETCSKCHCSKCQCKCVVICTKCKDSKCDGKCCVILCIKCQSPKCSGQCSPCKPPPPPPQPCHKVVQCPPWCTCPKCYVPYYCPPPPCPPPCAYRVVYESNPDNCSIM